MHPFVDLEIAVGSAGVYWFEQSSFALKDSAGTIVFVDPYSPHDRPAAYIHAEPPIDESQWQVDVVLLTHDHGDHTHPETLARIHAASPHARYVGPSAAIDHILSETQIGADRCTRVTAGDHYHVPGTGVVQVDSVFAKLPAGDPGANIAPPDTEHLGFVVGLGGVRVYVTGDPINTFANHRALTDPVERLQPTVGLMTTHPSEGEFPFFAGCVEMARRVGLRTAVPAHYQCFVARNYNPLEWQTEFTGSPETCIIDRQSHAVFAAS